MFNKNNLLIPKWNKQYPDLLSGFTLPFYGNQALTRKSRTNNRTTKENRYFLADKLKVDIKNFFYPHQIHSDIIIRVDKNKKGLGAYSLNNAIKGDACITNEKDILLMVSWADCIPILLYDPISNWIAAVHSGWRGTVSNIIGKTINTLKENNADPEKILAAIGPGIRNCCYKVGNEFQEHFKETGLSKFLKEKKEGLYFDLAGSVYKQLIDSGIKKTNIDFYGNCNSCSKDPVFFSCRKDGKNFEGQAAFIGLF
jgi:YfiH family protein